MPKVGTFVAELSHVARLQTGNTPVHPIQGPPDCLGDAMERVLAGRRLGWPDRSAADRFWRNVESPSGSHATRLRTVRTAQRLPRGIATPPARLRPGRNCCASFLLTLIGDSPFYCDRRLAAGRWGGALAAAGSQPIRLR